MTPEACPFCKAIAALVDRLAHGWRHCNGCSRTFQVDDDGMVIRIAAGRPDVAAV